MEKIIKTTRGNIIASNNATDILQGGIAVCQNCKTAIFVSNKIFNDYHIDLETLKQLDCCDEPFYLWEDGRRFILLEK